MATDLYKCLIRYLQSRLMGWLMERCHRVTNWHLAAAQWQPSPQAERSLLSSSNLKREYCISSAAAAGDEEVTVAEEPMGWLIILA